MNRNMWSHRNPLHQPRRVAVAGRSVFVAAVTWIAALVIGLCDSPTLLAQGFSSPSTQRPSAASALRPIGSPSAVDAYRGRQATPIHQARAVHQAASVREAPSVHQASPVRQAVWMQSSGRSLAAPDLPPGGYDFPPSSQPPASGSGGGGFSPRPGGDASLAAPPVTSPGVTPPRSLPTPSREDYAPIPQPQIGQAGYARVDNCAMVSAPSTYVAASGIGCGSPVGYGAPASYSGPSGYAAPPAEFAAPVALPPAGGPPVLGATGVRPSPLPPLFTLGQERNPVQVGQGLWGQPVAYVPGQGVRNFVRYWFP